MNRRTLVKTFLSALTLPFAAESAKPAATNKTVMFWPDGDGNYDVMIDVNGKSKIFKSSTMVLLRKNRLTGKYTVHWTDPDTKKLMVSGVVFGDLKNVIMMFE
jgi:hypothetical protein